MLSDPTGNDDVAKAAVPDEVKAEPKIVVPCLKVTASPSGGGPALELTVALKVTL